MSDESDGINEFPVSGMADADTDKDLVMSIDCSRSMSAREASLMLEWATECSDPVRAAELLRVFKALGGLQLFQETVADSNGPQDPTGGTH